MTDIITLENLVTLLAIYIFGFVCGMVVNQFCKDMGGDYPTIDPDPDGLSVEDRINVHEERPRSKGCP